MRRFKVLQGGTEDVGLGSGGCSAFICRAKAGRLEARAAEEYWSECQENGGWIGVIQGRAGAALRERDSKLGAPHERQSSSCWMSPGSTATADAREQFSKSAGAQNEGEE